MNKEEHAAALADLKARTDTVSASRPVLDVSKLEDIQQKESRGFDSFSSIYQLVPVLEGTGITSLNDFATLVCRYTETSSIYPSIGSVSIVELTTQLFASIHIYMQDPALGVACLSCLIHPSRLVDTLGGAFASEYNELYDEQPTSIYTYCRAIQTRAGMLLADYTGQTSIKVLPLTLIQMQYTLQKPQQPTAITKAMTPMDILQLVSGPTDVQGLEDVMEKHPMLHTMQETVYSKRNGEFSYYPGVMKDLYNKDTFLSNASERADIGVTGKLYENIGNSYDYVLKNENVALHEEPDTWQYGTSRFAKELGSSKDSRKQSLDVNGFLYQAQHTQDKLQKQHDRNASQQGISRISTQVADTTQDTEADAWIGILKQSKKLEATAAEGMSNIDAVNVELGVMGGVSSEFLPTFAHLPRNTNTHVHTLQQEYRRETEPVELFDAIQCFQSLFISLDSPLKEPELIQEQHQRPCVVYHSPYTQKYMKIQLNAASGVPKHNIPQFVHNQIHTDEPSIETLDDAEKYISTITDYTECMVWASIDEFASHCIPLSFIKDENNRWKVGQFENIFVPYISTYAVATESLELDRQMKQYTSK